MSTPMNTFLRLLKLKNNRYNAIYGYKLYSKKGANALPDNSPLKDLMDDSAAYIDRKPTDADDEWATLPYSRLPMDYSEKPKVDPRDTSVILFPGQGSQYVGMGGELQRFPVARQIYQIANDVLNFNLQKVCLEGPQDLLDKHCQLAVMVTSLAACERLKEERPSAIEKCTAVAGFSLGEITALVFAGALEYEQALRLVQVRATAMAAASEENPGGMMQIIFTPDAQISMALEAAVKHCRQNGLENADCRIANYLFPACKIIAGSKLALKFIEENGDKFGIRKTKRIPVTGPFHCELMRSAVMPFRAALRLCEVKKPIVKVISNVNAKAYRNEEDIVKQLPRQIVQAVRWEQSMHSMFARREGEYFPQIFAIGPGQSVRTILRKINAPAWDHCISIEA